jgi:membrane protein DedA with SNARE-associated domain
VTLDLPQLISLYGLWVVAGFIALESIGIPLPAEATLIAAAFFAARTHAMNIWVLVAVGVVAAIGGEVLGFWIGRKFGYRLMVRYGSRFGLTEERTRISQWLFLQYGGTFVFTARFLPFLRNMGALLAGANCMAQHRFYLASGAAAASWVMGYGLLAYSFGEAFTTLASPAAVSLGVAMAFLAVGLPALIVRYEKSLSARMGCELPKSV